jgi:hypothetical protein
MKILKAILLSLAVLIGYQPDCEAVEVQPDSNSLLKLIDAIAQKESGGNPDAVNWQENAVGLLQIRPIMVLEVNRICSLLKIDYDFELADRKNPAMSRRMALIYFSFCQQYFNLDFEQLARNWQGGIYGYRKVCTRQYAKDVMKIYEATK